MEPAAAKLPKSVQLDEVSVERCVEAAWAAHSRGDWDEANQRWAAIRERFPACLEGYSGGGASLKAAQRYDEADEVYRWAFARFPVSAGLLGDFAAVAQARGDTAEASRRWIVARTLFPDRADVLLREVRAFRDAGLFGAAEIILDEVSKRYPESLSIAPGIQPETELSGGA